ncbi:carbohydrate ABC transporter permease [Deinococcus yavapaiensis]|uniref:Carbohydrate ABC transporter membrane protein 1 (CUT1 family) n=1 Tax=Deinococcus yavapaiensis KR-236 TaxID=694435 RepID=A0A318S4J9_9DEIO|nr:sugar ABC transporter permease [Deinococcus yavapaiensis]PYE51900.1 carbohydrate ABC transporter membrane protein 1 (CUT1 family) [Deinococcus yavapaiensis KR-236]
MNAQQRSVVAAAILFLAPFLATLAVFFVYAFCRAVYFSFTNYNLFDQMNFVGLRNYAAIFGDNLFLSALRNTLLFSLITTALQTILALLMANVLNQKVKGITFFRTAWYMPSITSSVVIGLIFLWLFQRVGLANYLLTQISNYGSAIMTFLLVLVAVQIVQVVLERARRLPASWFDPALAVVSALIALIVTWLLVNFGVVRIGDNPAVNITYYATQEKLFGFLPVPLATIIAQNVFTTVPTLMLFFLAGLQNVPRALYEAAEIDGATKAQQLLYVTVPMLRPVTFYVVTVGLIGTLQMFDQVAIIGDAAPLESIVTLAYFVFTRVFSGGVAEAGFAMAGAVILAAITLLIVLLQRRFFVSDEAFQ